MFGGLLGEWAMRTCTWQVCASLSAACRDEAQQERQCRAAGKHEESKVNDCSPRSRRSARPICHSRVVMHSSVGSAKPCCLNVMAAHDDVAAAAGVTAKVKASESALLGLATT